ncbi:MAG: hypothetical protein CMI01_05790 [Oceanospirillaceae bacterium]|jgi:LPS-assembly lipoprotein|uniref:LPS-assembly lipoprotein LptE n=1 Tax=Marinobacterium litorale TaxID=404770 RepID=UPI00040452D5|nr:LPS assembly lipoprotein LptE [Marinobacterium litorale]MBS98171.1 hypothetical protein [Oceanospirillaceae bacterium]
MYKRRFWLGLLLTSVISGCGFHLAGYQPVPESLRQVDLVISERRPSQIRSQLNNLLEVSGIEITSSANKRLQIHSENTRRRVLTRTVSDDAIEYELIATALFSVFDRDGKPLIDRREVRAERVFNDDDNTTARDALENQIKQDLQGQLANQILRQYLSLAPAE